MARKFVAQNNEGSALLDALLQYIIRFVHLTDSQARIAVLWTVHTYAVQFADTTPYLAVTSAEKQCGKSRLLEVFETLVMNPWMTGRVTAAVLTRKIDAKHPTLLLDESDAAFGGNKEYAEALRGVLNTGHRRGGRASCCVGQGADISFRDFSTFCPKVIAGIGKLPDTVADRSIPIRLKRAALGEGVARFREREVRSEATKLRATVEAWCTLNASKLREARPELPQELTDRLQDGAEPLLSIADAAGGEWPQTRRALVELCNEAQSSDDSIGTRLLADILQIFQENDADRATSADLAAILAEIETSQWGEWSHGRPLTPTKLARLLKPFEIGPEVMRIGASTPRGYRREQFLDAFKRYLRVEDSTPVSSATPQSATTQHNAAVTPSDAPSGCSKAPDVAVRDCESRNNNGPCCTVTDSNPPEGQR